MMELRVNASALRPPDNFGRLLSVPTESSPIAAASALKRQCHPSIQRLIRCVIAHLSVVAQAHAQRIAQPQVDTCAEHRCAAGDGGAGEFEGVTAAEGRAAFRVTSP